MRGMSDFVHTETASGLYYVATTHDARDGVEVTIWRTLPGGLRSLTRRELLPGANFETVVEKLSAAGLWL